MSDGPFNAARWIQTAEALGFRVQVVVGDSGKVELDVIVPRGIRKIGEEAKLWSDLRPTPAMARLNEATLCQYLKRTGRAVRARESLGRSKFARRF